MDHQRFETWIVGPPTQKPEDAHALQQHLEACPTCRTLQSNWQSAEQALKRAPQLSPRPGFNTRWQSSLAERRTRQHIRQVRTLLLTLGLGSLASLLILIGIFLTVASPVDLLVGGARLITTLNGWLIAAQRLITSLLTNPLPLAVWIVLGCGFCLLVTTWVLTLWRISVKGVTVK